MNFPNELQYVKSHEWIKMTGEGCAEIGLSDYAQDSLGELVFINLPEVGDPVTVGEAFADVESVKAVSDVFSPVDAVVAEINEELIDNPGQLNEAPYDAWIIRVKGIANKGDLLDAAAYEAACAEEM